MDCFFIWKIHNFAFFQNDVMSSILIYFIAGLFIALLFLNLFFRIRVIKVYKKLIQKKVEFNSIDIFRSEDKMKEIYQQYPDSVKDIQAFMYNIRLSVGMAIGIVLLITLLGVVLHYLQ